MNYKIVRITDRPELKETAAQWFHEKWYIPTEAYLESMDDAINGGSAVPEWYMAMDGERIVGGMGVIENDFHERKDLAPNVCAVFTEPEYRCRGIAGALLDFISEDMKSRGIDTLYLITSHESLYDRFGWEFFCMAKPDDEDELSRIYIHRAE